ncbi:MAG: hypothetical protein MRJ67_14520 [Nitrospirales bacterium]|nr:hypothetical protein [Nitrospirales bacterium]MDR4482166.1 hypothetical protein [Nitrospirales bacterium]
MNGKSKQRNNRSTIVGCPVDPAHPQGLEGVGERGLRPTIGMSGQGAV